MTRKKAEIMSIYELTGMTVEADVSRPSPMYRPPVAVNNIPLILLIHIFGPLDTPYHVALLS